MITKEEALILKAISILSIILTHFWGWICPLPTGVNMLVSSISQAGVEIFLFLSGYGIMCSYKNNGLQKFWMKRFHKIYVPLLLVTVPQLLFEIWTYRNHIGDMYITSTFLSALGLYPNNILDGTLWFVPFILLQYMVFYCSFKWTNKKKYNYILLLIGTLLIYFLFKAKFTWVSECDLYAFSFMFGVLYADRKKNVKISNKDIVLFVFLFVLSVLFGEMKLGKYINEISLVILEIWLVHVVAGKHNIIMKAIKFLGGISYELYLTEGIFFWNKIIYDVLGYHCIGLLAHLLIIIILGFLIQRISNIIIRVLIEISNKFCGKRETV